MTVFLNCKISLLNLKTWLCSTSQSRRVSAAGAPTRRLPAPPPPHGRKEWSSSPCLWEGQREVTAAAAGYFISRSERLPSRRSKSCSAVQTHGGDTRLGSTRLSDNRWIKRYRGEEKERKAAAMICRHVAHHPPPSAPSPPPAPKHGNNSREIISSHHAFC